MLALILADRDLVGAVGEHVCGLEHRVEEQAGRRRARAGPPTSSLNWVIRFSSPNDVTLESSQQSSGVLLDVALAEEDAAFGVAGQPPSRIAAVS